MIEYKLVNAIANVESKAGDGSQGGGGSGGWLQIPYKKVAFLQIPYKNL